MLGSPAVTAVAPTLELGTTVRPAGRLVPICLGGRFQWGLGASPFSWSFLVCAGCPRPQAWPCSGSGLFSSFGFPFLLPSGGLARLPFLRSWASSHSWPTGRCCTSPEFRPGWYRFWFSGFSSPLFFRSAICWCPRPWGQPLEQGQLWPRYPDSFLVMVQTKELYCEKIKNYC